ncbi:MAG: hypothetical protein H6Q20_1458 [Bacteroidetes bacterium]|jgi:hypothetical protein|nr:hypothetical protein [Bacteroidota bacterium]
MASRRKLKKTIQYVSSELITELYFQLLVGGKADVDKTENIVGQIAANSVEFCLRANRPSGKDNPKLVKDYYRKLFADWKAYVDKIIQEIESL